MSTRIAIVGGGLGGLAAALSLQLREAHRLFTEIGAPIRAEQVAKELAG